MPTARQRATDDAAESTTAETVPANQALEDIEAAFSDVPEDAKITLYRRQQDTGKWGLLDTYAPDMFSVDAVARKYGGGVYNALATARVKGKPGRPRVANVQFTVDPNIGGEKKNGGEPAGRNNLADVLEAANVQALTSIMQTMQGTAAAANRPPIDWPAIATAAAPIVVALLERRGVDPLETAAKLVELTRPEGKAPEFSQLFDVFSQGLEFASDQKPDSLSRVADTVTQLVDRVSKSEDAPKMLAPGEDGVPPAAAPPVPAGAPPWLEVIRPFMGYLVKQAAAGKSPQLYAEWLVDQLPPEAVPVINGLVAEPAFPENVVAILPPQVQPAAPWFRMLCLEVASILEAVGEPAPPEEPREAPTAPAPFARPPEPPPSIFDPAPASRRPDPEEDTEDAD